LKFSSPLDNEFEWNAQEPKEAKMPETKRDRFVRLAERRTNSVIERIRVLSNCSNRYAYEYYDEDVRKMFSAIEKELKAARAKFESGLITDRFTLT
jgi:hypothetical protein